MGLYTAAFLLGALISTVDGSDMEGYSKTEGAWILSLNKRTYSVNTVAECATKCNTETSFTCKSFIYNEKDQECWTAAANSKTVSVFRRSTIALYEKNAYLLECVNGIGSNYRGTKSRTKSGKICQRWDSSYPHRPNFKPQSHPQADLESNFCRNPDGDSNGLWCYTTDRNTRWEYCNVPSCFDYVLECVNGIGSDYRGTKSRTNSGKICQRWDSSYPHRQNFKPQSYPHADLESNFCRNPDGDRNGPWCYTTDPNTRWEHCNVPSCFVSRRRATHKQSFTPTSAETLMGTAMDHGVTLRILMPAGSTATYLVALGDRGGPLVCYEQNRFVLQGVTTWAEGCMLGRTPSVYTQVSKFVDWIDATIKAN